MATFNTALQDLLALAENQALWIQDLVNALGNPRTFIIKHMPGATAETTDDQVWTSGTIVWQSSLIGDLAPSNGALRKLGRVKNVTVQQAADLSVGKAVMRVSGNDNWMQATVGPVGSTAEVKLTPLTGSGGLAFGNNFAIYPPQDIPADAGVDKDMPYRVVIEEWTNGVPGARQTIFFDDPRPDIIFQDAAKNAEIGPVPYCRSTSTLINGGNHPLGYKFELGIHRFRLPPNLNAEDATKPVWEMVVLIKPKDRWSGYPTLEGYDPATDSTFLRSCKIHVYKQDGSIWHIFQSLRDDTPLNDPSWPQIRDETNAWRPFVNTAQGLFHRSHRLKEASDARTTYGGTPSEWTRPKLSKSRAFSNPSLPTLGAGGVQVNGYNHPLLMQKWSLDMSQATWDAVRALRVAEGNSDPNVNWNTGNAPGLTSKYPTHATGYAFDYGAYNAGHEPRLGPGGLRFDRYAHPSLLTYYLNDPTGVRPEGNVPWREMWDHYAAGNWNQAQYHVTDPRTGATLPHANIISGVYQYAEGYYNAQHTGQEEPSKWLPQWSMSANGWSPNAVDRDGLYKWSGHGLDNLHAYTKPGWDFTHFNSVAAAWAQKFKLYATLMCWDSGVGTNLANYLSSDTPVLFQRHHAWRWGQMAFAWKSRADHELFISEAEWVNIWKAEFESLYDNAVVPSTDPAHPQYDHVFFAGLRRFGFPVRRVTTGSDHYLAFIDDDKKFYLFGELITMQNMGCLSFIKNINTKCSQAVDWLIGCYGRAAAERTVKTKAVKQYGQIVPTVPQTTELVLPASWDEIAATMQPNDGSECVKNPDGSIYLGIIPSLSLTDLYRERWQYQHLMQQACHGLVDIFGSYNIPYAPEAKALWVGWEDFTTLSMSNGTPQEWGLRHAACGPVVVAA